jgi:hypothetical protein
MRRGRAQKDDGLQSNGDLTRKISNGNMNINMNQNYVGSGVMQSQFGPLQTMQNPISQIHQSIQNQQYQQFGFGEFQDNPAVPLLPPSKPMPYQNSTTQQLNQQIQAHQFNDSFSKRMSVNSSHQISSNPIHQLQNPIPSQINHVQQQLNQQIQNQQFRSDELSKRISMNSQPPLQRFNQNMNNGQFGFQDNSQQSWLRNQPAPQSEYFSKGRSQTSQNSQQTSLDIFTIPQNTFDIFKQNKAQLESAQLDPYQPETSKPDRRMSVNRLNDYLLETQTDTKIDKRLSINYTSDPDNFEKKQVEDLNQSMNELNQIGLKTLSMGRVICF